MIAALLLSLLLCFSTDCGASTIVQVSPSPTPQAAQPVASTPGPKPVGLTKGAAAPFTGVLYNEADVEALLRAASSSQQPAVWSWKYSLLFGTAIALSIGAGYTTCKNL